MMFFRKMGDDKPIVEITPAEPLNLVFGASGDYPELVNVVPNRETVRQLKAFTAGKDSELSAVLTYLYQHYVLGDKYPITSSALEQIALIEMEHYELLSEAVVAFGGDPTLTDGIGNVWTGRNIDTVRNPRQMILNNLKGEESAVIAYEKAAAQTDNESLANLYLRIAEDEKAHAVVLEQLLTILSPQ